MYIEETRYFEKGDRVFVESHNYLEDDKLGIVIEDQGFNSYRPVKVKLDTGEEIMVEPCDLYLDE
ncbi:MAG: hypothetical protein LLF98_01850 [Clostridium sp.]|uniref:hypothetical protein n=1 Tax=Clostridium sp. TaxID=1506 RepID=UPI0025C14A19|nr:hypothetical protein [Clostridium sp.]MCE5220024.1 hypothetical protein [Clostridium sp.]